MSLLRLLRAEVLLEFFNIRRSPAQSVLAIALMVALFMLLVGFARTVAGDVNPLSLTRLVVGYLLVLLTLPFVSGPSSALAEQNKSGMLENLLLAGYPLAWLLVAKTLVRYLLEIPKLALSAAVLIVLTKISLVWDLRALYLLVFFMVMALGLGFLLASLSLLVREARVPIMLAQLALFPLLLGDFPNLWLIPLAPAAYQIKSMLIGKQAGVVEPVLVVATSFLVLALGVRLFSYAEHMVRTKGWLGHQ